METRSGVNHRANTFDPKRSTSSKSSLFTSALNRDLYIVNPMTFCVENDSRSLPHNGILTLVHPIPAFSDPISGKPPGKAWSRPATAHSSNLHMCAPAYVPNRRQARARGSEQVSMQQSSYTAGRQCTNAHWSRHLCQKKSKKGGDKGAPDAERRTCNTRSILEPSPPFPQ